MTGLVPFFKTKTKSSALATLAPTAAATGRRKPRSAACVCPHAVTCCWASDSCGIRFSFALARRPASPPGSPGVPANGTTPKGWPEGRDRRWRRARTAQRARRAWFRRHDNGTRCCEAAHRSIRRSAWLPRSYRSAALRCAAAGPRRPPTTASRGSASGRAPAADSIRCLEAPTKDAPAGVPEVQPNVGDVGYDPFPGKTARFGSRLPCAVDPVSDASWQPPSQVVFSAPERPVLKIIARARRASIGGGCECLIFLERTFRVHISAPVRTNAAARTGRSSAPHRAPPGARTSDTDRRDCP